MEQEDKKTVLMKTSHCFQDVKSVAREIMSYLKDHPDAQDTIDGIVHWWVLDRNIRLQTTMVKKAVEALVREGLVIKENRGANMPVYRLNDGSGLSTSRNRRLKVKV